MSDLDYLTFTERLSIPILVEGERWRYVAVPERLVTEVYALVGLTPGRFQEEPKTPKIPRLKNKATKEEINADIVLIKEWLDKLPPHDANRWSLTSALQRRERRLARMKKEHRDRMAERAIEHPPL